MHTGSMAIFAQLFSFFSFTSGIYISTPNAITMFEKPGVIVEGPSQSATNPPSRVIVRW
jgi:hypothetical protein